MQDTLLARCRWDVDGCRRLRLETRQGAVRGAAGGAVFDTPPSSGLGVRAPLGPVDATVCWAREACAAGPAMAFWHRRRQPRERRCDDVSPFGHRRRSAGAKPVRAARATLLRGEGTENSALDPRSARAAPPGVAATARFEGRGERT
jgi:hypothetical protein